MNIKYNQEKSQDPSYGVIEIWDKSKLIFSITGNIREFLEWVIFNRTLIINELFFFGNENCSLAQRMRIAREIEFNDELDDNIVFDYWHGQIFEYYKSHGLTFALRGFDNLDIIIGKNLKQGEFSCYKDGKELLRYKFDLDAFFHEVEIRYKEIEKEM